jgi:hypothetical protein
MSINVEEVGGGLGVQHYVSLSDLQTPLGGP